MTARKKFGELIPTCGSLKRCIPRASPSPRPERIVTSYPAILVRAMAFLKTR
jgi:hypothetical protein